MEPEIEKLVKQTFCEYLSREVRRPQVHEDKEKFIQLFYPPAPFFEIGWMIPAGVLAAVFIIFFNFVYRVPGTVTVPGAFKMHAASQPELPPENPEQIYKTPRVIVKRVASQTGSTMIYQRSFRNIPITVIWVFPGGGPS